MNRGFSTRLKSIICSEAVLDATNSDPYVAVSTVACLFEYESIGVCNRSLAYGTLLGVL